MPIYEYQCPHCRKNFEEWLKSDDDASAHPCPTCGASSPRIISQSTFILKGGGWYVTEYGSHHAENEAAAETSADTPKNSAAGADAEAPAAGKTTDGKAQNTVTSGDTRKTKNTSAAPAKGSAKAASSPRKTPPTKDASKAS